MSVEVAVTGLGVLSGFGHGVEPFWQGLVAGESAVGPIRRFTPAARGGLGAEVPPLELRRFVHSAVGRRIDWLSLLAVAACRLALDDAGVGALVPARTGVTLGSAFANLQEATGFLDRLLARGTGNPLVFPNLVFNAPLAYATIELGVTGPSAMLAAGEASGEAGIAAGAELIARGAVDVCLAGGADELAPVLERVLADGRRRPAEMPRPLDPAARGAVPGEGAAVLVLESLEHARRRGARVYARLVPQAGRAVPSPVHGWPRDPGPLAEALAPAVAGADLVLAAASGAPALDAVEAEALARASAGRPPAVTAVRGAIGDFGAAGALAAAAAALAIAHGVVPPTAGHVPPARGGLDVVHGRARRVPVRVAVTTGMARGGVCHPLRLEAA